MKASFPKETTWTHLRLKQNKQCNISSPVACVVVTTWLAMNAFKGRQQWVTKHFSGWAGSGAMMNKRKTWDTLSCHRCGETEATIHTVRCQAQESVEKYTSLRKDLQSWLRKTMSLAIMQAILIYMDSYQQSKQVTDVSDIYSDLHVAWMYQATIGPRSFREGLLVSFQWRVAQQRYYVNETSKEKIKRWVSKLIQKLWEVSWGMWEFQNNNIHTNAETRRD